MTDHPVVTRIESRIGILTFNRPKSLNAFNGALIDAVNQAMIEFTEDPRVLCVVVHGAGRCFSAGFDLKESAQLQIRGEDRWREVLDRDFDFIMQFWHCAKPTVAAAHGYCLGGAFELLMASDISVAAEGALLGQPEMRFGSGIVAMMAPWVTGPKQAKELLLTGNDRLTAGHCYDMGLLNRVVPDGSELACAMEIAHQIAAGAPRSVQLTKRAINRSYESANMESALRQALDVDVAIESDESPERLEFNRIRSAEGLKAALAWRDGRGKSSTDR